MHSGSVKAKSCGSCVYGSVSTILIITRSKHSQGGICSMLAYGQTGSGKTFTISGLLALLAPDLFLRQNQVIGKCPSYTSTVLLCQEIARLTKNISTVLLGAIFSVGFGSRSTKQNNEDQDPGLKSMVYISANIIMWKCSVVDPDLVTFFCVCLVGSHITLLDIEKFTSYCNPCYVMTSVVDPE
jgi:hypothetical protein